ncbi:rhodanese-like domain-containing protein [Hymenobacter sp. BT730]|uniref:rhodanese-like domain-containing protein n=1 Tax=Hymenobacter sp. BT730 TaxID=3063332 RepID=UPI0026DED0E0|nr:rhodanese-like domain-containing protein [Hymenobacter sp. BT730]
MRISSLSKLLFLMLSAGCLAGSGLAQGLTPPPADVAPKSAVKLVKKHKVLPLDVRTPEEYHAGHLQGARNLDIKSPEFATQLAQLDTAQTYLVYCASGNRSSKAANMMREKGLRHVINAGAYIKLKEAGAKTE